MRDPRPRLQAWLSGLPFFQDALFVAASLFLLAWPFFVVLDLADGSPSEALTFALLFALPLGSWMAYRRRTKRAE